jgi:hypothetical protein
MVAHDQGEVGFMQRGNVVGQFYWWSVRGAVLVSQLVTVDFLSDQRI